MFLVTCSNNQIQWWHLMLLLLRPAYLHHNFAFMQNNIPTLKLVTCVSLTWGFLTSWVYLFISSFPFQKLLFRREDNYKVEDEWSNPLPWIFSFSCIIHIFWLGVGSTSWMLILMLAAVCPLPLPPVSFQENISGAHLFSSSWFRGVAGLSLLYLLIGSIPCAFKVCVAKKFSDLEWTQAALLPGVYKPQGTWGV